jgi:hypothetical protein
MFLFIILIHNIFKKFLIFFLFWKPLPPRNLKLPDILYERLVTGILEFISYNKCHKSLITQYIWTHTMFIVEHRVEFTV